MSNGQSKRHAVIVTTIVEIALYTRRAPALHLHICIRRCRRAVASYLTLARMTATAACTSISIGSIGCPRRLLWRALLLSLSLALCFNYFPSLRGPPLCACFFSPPPPAHLPLRCVVMRFLLILRPAHVNFRSRLFFTAAILCFSRYRLDFSLYL